MKHSLPDTIGAFNAYLDSLVRILQGLIQNADVQRPTLSLLLRAQLLPPRAQVSKNFLHVQLLAECHPDILKRPRYEARERALLVHDLVETLNEDGHDIRHWVTFQDQARHSPLEVAHYPLLRLVYHALWEDVHPRMPSADIL